MNTRKGINISLALWEKIIYDTQEIFFKIISLLANTLHPSPLITLIEYNPVNISNKNSPTCQTTTLLIKSHKYTYIYY